MCNDCGGRLPQGHAPIGDIVRAWENSQSISLSEEQFFVLVRRLQDSMIPYDGDPQVILRRIDDALYGLSRLVEAPSAEPRIMDAWDHVQSVLAELGIVQ